MTCLPIASAVARAMASASSEESIPAMSSTSAMTGAGLKKCRPTTRPGSAAAGAIAVIGIDDVLEASTARGATRDSSANSSRLSSSDSGAASTISSQGASSATVPTPSRRSADAASARPFTAQRLSPSRARSRPRCRASSSGSSSRTRAPEAAASCAIPEPIVPAPTTPTTRAAGIVVVSVAEATYASALMPVSERPMMSFWICDVPS